MTLASYHTARLEDGYRETGLRCPDKLRELRVQINRLIRREKLVASSVPLLAPQRWARSWQTTHRQCPRQNIRKLEALLAKIALIIGPPPEWWKPRPTRPCDSRIRRQYDNLKATFSFACLKSRLERKEAYDADQVQVEAGVAPDGTDRLVERPTVLRGRVACQPTGAA